MKLRVILLPTQEINKLKTSPERSKKKVNIDFDTGVFAL